MWKPCSEMHYSKESDLTESKPILIKPKEIIVKRLYFQTSFLPKKHFKKDGISTYVTLKMYFTILNSNGIIYQRYKMDTNIVYAVSDSDYSWFNNRESIGNGGHVMDLSYKKGEYLFENINPF